MPAGSQLDGPIKCITANDGTWLFSILSDACRDATFTGSRLKDVLSSAKLLHETSPLITDLAEDQNWMSEYYKLPDEDDIHLMIDVIGNPVTGSPLTGISYTMFPQRVQYSLGSLVRCWRKATTRIRNLDQDGHR